MQITSLEDRAVGPFDSDTVQKMNETFYNAAQRCDIKFGVAEYGYASFADPTDTGVMLGWYYRDERTGKEYGDQLFMRYGTQLGRGYDTDLAMQNASVLGHQAKFTMDLVENPIARFRFLAPRRARQFAKDIKVVILAFALLPLHGALQVFGDVDAADELIEWWKKYVL